MRHEDEIERAKQLSYIESALESLKKDEVPKRLEEVEAQEALIKNQLANKIGSLLGANVLKKIPNFNETEASSWRSIYGDVGAQQGQVE